MNIYPPRNIQIIRLILWISVGLKLLPHSRVTTRPFSLLVYLEKLVYDDFNEHIYKHTKYNEQWVKQD